MIKLIVFDLDDTITDNRYLDFESFNSTCIFLNITNSLTLKKLLMLRKNKKTAKMQYPKAVFRPPTRRYLNSSVCFENKKCIS